MVKNNMQSTTIEGKKQRSLKEYFGLTLRGICMGASDIVPGVSGGTMAFILGIYEELIDSIRTVGQPEFLQAVLKFRIKDAFQILNWQFLLAVGLGILIAIFTLAKGLEWLLLNQPVYLWSFFFGLVIASVFTVSKRVKKWTPPLWAMMVIGAVGAFVLVGLVPAQTPDAWWFLILSGAFAICAMILPGISGAFILVLLGKYQFVLNAVNERDFLTLILVAVGAGIGLVSFAQLLGWLFKRYHDMTVAVLIGLMVGSLRKIWPWKVDVDWLRDAVGGFLLDSHGERVVTQQSLAWPDFATNAGVMEFVIALVLMLVGLGAILLLDRLVGEKDAH
jgi:putative membrane protein